MKGLILSGGKGTRLRPLTHTYAKQLVPVANKPVLFYGIESIVEAGIKDIGIVVGDTERYIRDAVGDGSKFGAKITYIRQPEPLGLAHAVKVSKEYLGDEKFIMYLGDNLLSGGVKEIVERFVSSNSNATILLAEVDEPQHFGVAEVKDGKVIRLVEKPKIPPSNLALVGVYMFDSFIFEAVDNIKPSFRGELEITDAIQYLIDKGFIVDYQLVKGWWKDTGKVDDLLEANRIILDDLQRSIGDCSIESSKIEGRVHIGKDSRVINSTIRGPVVVGEGVVIKDSFVGPYTSIGDTTFIRSCEVENSIIMEKTVVENIPYRIDSSVLGKEVFIRKKERTPAVLRLVLGDHSGVEIP